MVLIRLAFLYAKVLESTQNWDGWMV